MQKKLDGPSQLGQVREVIKGLKKRTRVAYSTLCLLAIIVMFAGCGGGGGEGVSSQVVSGVAATGSPLAGQVKIKDSSTLPREKATVIANDGFFALDVSDMQGPFILQATGTANGTSYVLHSFANGPGTANINPLSDAAVANAAGVSDPAQVYEHPDAAILKKIDNNLSDAVTELQDALQPLMTNFSSDKVDPIRDHYKADHTGLDGLFDNVQITIVNGIITVNNLNTGAVIYTGEISDLRHGHFTEDDDDLPNPGAVPTAPHRITATGGATQVTITWKSVGNATSYNIYWSTTAGVTKASSTKIAGATSPYEHTVLSADTAYYYIVTAVNGAGESAASSEATAKISASAPAPVAVPSAPTGVMATGGTNQATISWSAVAGATSYNIYWSKTEGVTASTGTKIAGTTSSAVQTGLTADTTYYYIVTAVNSAGESVASVQAAATTLSATSPLPAVPAASTSLTATGGASQVTVSWSAVTGAASYNIYWSTTTGVTTATGTKIAGTTSPYVHTGLAAGTAYYYFVTAVNSNGIEGAASAQATATTSMPAPLPQTWALYNLYCDSCHGTSKRTATVTGVRAAISSNLGRMGMFTATDCTSCHGAGKAGQSTLTDAIIANILAGT